MIAVQVGADLCQHADFDQLFRQWLTGHPVLGQATQELERFLADDGGRLRLGPIWQDDSWREPWLAELLADQPSADDRTLCKAAVGGLVAGRAEVVITGQQPGFLGGPLYTAYKVATAVALAELRTAAGVPTVPVFWSAGDDDDIREALQPMAWDPERAVLLRHELHGRRGLVADRMVGALPAAEIADGASRWLSEHAGRHGLAADLADLWREGLSTGISWGRLQRRALLRLFRGRGLLVVHGDDPGLHRSAQDFYLRLWEDRQQVRHAARQGGQIMERAGFQAALSEASIQRFLHRGRDGRRQPLPADYAGELPDASELRPGVVARSAVQDWLFQPAGVVIGPGEVAYLKQLQPVYEHLDLPRAPLLARLFAQLGPEGHGDFRAWAMELADGEPVTDQDDDQDEARAVSQVAAAELRAYLGRATGCPDKRAGQLTEQVTERWARYLAGVVARENQRQRHRSSAVAEEWLRPEGRRQERSLATMAAGVLWGDGLVEALAHASRRHLDAGLAAEWREFLLTVPEP